MIKEHGHSCLDEKYSLMCSLADSTLEDMKKRICDGSICLNEIDCVSANEHQAMKLCTGDTECNISAYLDMRKYELSAFKCHKSQLGSFCREMEMSKFLIEGNQTC